MKNSVLDYPPGAGIAKAKTLIKSVPVSADSEEYSIRLKQFQDLRGQLLPVEEAALAKLIEEEQVVAEQFALAKTLERISYLGEAKLLDPAVFDLRRKDGLPVLAPFSIEKSTVEFRSNGEHQVPNCCSGFYKDVTAKLSRRASLFNCLLFPVMVMIPFFLALNLVPDMALGVASLIAKISLSLGAVFGAAVLVYSFVSLFEDKVEDFFFGLMIAGLSVAAAWFWPILVLGSLGIWSYRHFQKLWIASAKFTGLIPALARFKIQEAKRCKGFKEIFLLAEVPKWEIKNKPMPVPTMEGDPLTVGFDGERFWLLDYFETTTAERYIADEFTSKPESSAQ